MWNQPPDPLDAVTGRDAETGTAGPTIGRSGEVKDLLVEAEPDARADSSALDEGWFDALAMLVMDATLEADRESIAVAREGVSRLVASMEGPDLGTTERRGRLLGILDMADWGLDRIGPLALAGSMEPESHGARFLVIVSGRPGASNKDLAASLGVDDTEVSRVGRRLLQAGLAERHRVGRTNSWRLTSRGLQVAKALAGAHQVAATVIDTTKPAAMSHRNAVGIEIRPDDLVYSVVDERGGLLSTGTAPWDTNLGPIATITHLVQVVSERAQEDLDLPVGAVGLAFAGHVDHQNGTVVRAPKYAGFDWQGVELAKLVADQSGLPTILDNDANTLLMWEQQRRRAANAPVGSLVVVLVGDSGLGAALAWNGELIHGCVGGAGELGHVIIEPHGAECSCGNEGCLEALASAKAVLTLQAAFANADTPLPDLAAFASRVARQEKAAMDALRCSADAIGQALSVVVNMLNPAAIVVFGPRDLIDAGQRTDDPKTAPDMFVSIAYDTCRALAYSTLFDACDLSFRSAEEFHVSAGAGLLAFSRVAGSGQDQHTTQALPTVDLPEAMIPVTAVHLTD